MSEIHDLPEERLAAALRTQVEGLLPGEATTELLIESGWLRQGVHVAEELLEILAGLSFAYGREEQLLPTATAAMRDLGPIYTPHGRKQDERAARPTAKG